MSDNEPKVGVIMGSDSDWPTMQKACEILDEFEVSYEKKVVSAHRTPDLMAKYGKEARDRGIQVIIAGAGGAAHLPGMTAAHTTLPVIGVPIKTSTLSGLDSLYSIVQMPPGVPVATVAIGKAGNAALLAIRMLGMSNPTLAEKLNNYHQEMAQASLDKTKNLT
ncbi:N5-carboxyaminoimidazole ribonucleotide mutase [Fodinibius salicampi]|nr:5-(carboxyamino)imidazole ribonucleotide mutase [Fodinibius salicampi]